MKNIEQKIKEKIKKEVGLLLKKEEFVIDSDLENIVFFVKIKKGFFKLKDNIAEFFDKYKYDVEDIKIADVGYKYFRLITKDETKIIDIINADKVFSFENMTKIEVEEVRKEAEKIYNEYKKKKEEDEKFKEEILSVCNTFIVRDLVNKFLARKIKTREELYKKLFVRYCEEYKRIVEERDELKEKYNDLADKMKDISFLTERIKEVFDEKDEEIKDLEERIEELEEEDY